MDRIIALFGVDGASDCFNNMISSLVCNVLNILKIYIYVKLNLPIPAIDFFPGTSCILGTYLEKKKKHFIN